MVTITALDKGYAISALVKDDKYVFAYTEAVTKNEAIEQFIHDIQSIVTELQSQLTTE